MGLLVGDARCLKETVARQNLKGIVCAGTALETGQQRAQPLLVQLGKCWA